MALLLTTRGRVVVRVVEAVLRGQRRVLLTAATGTGKTFTAFQICWKLWGSRWNARGEHGRPRIPYLADRNVLIDDPKDKTFTPFGGSGGGKKPLCFFVLH